MENKLMNSCISLLNDQLRLKHEALFITFRAPDDLSLVTFLDSLSLILFSYPPSVPFFTKGPRSCVLFSVSELPGNSMTYILAIVSSYSSFIFQSPFPGPLVLEYLPHWVALNHPVGQP